MGDTPNPPNIRKEMICMTELLFFVIGLLIGLLLGMVFICITIISRYDSIKLPRLRVEKKINQEKSLSE